MPGHHVVIGSPKPLFCTGMLQYNRPVNLITVMFMNEEIPGSCLCGTVRFTVHGPFQKFALCHCSRCRKSTGSAHASNIFTLASNIKWIAGEQQIRRYELATAERFSKCFCLICGSPVPSLGRDGQRLLIPAGSLDTDPRIRPQMRIYVDSRAPWYENLETVTVYTGAPPL